MVKPDNITQEAISTGSEAAQRMRQILATSKTTKVEQGVLDELEALLKIMQIITNN